MDESLSHADVRKVDDDDDDDNANSTVIGVHVHNALPQACCVLVDC